MGYQSITTLRDSRKVTARRIMHQWESRERFSEDTRKVTTKEAEEMMYVRVESLRNMIEILKDNGKDLKDLEDLIDDLPQIEIREVKHESSSGYDSSRI